MSCSTGKPIQVRPNMNTEVHFVMALFELHYATKQANYLVSCFSITEFSY